MYTKRKPWYRTAWGLPMAVILSPLWFIWKKSRRNRLLRTVVGGISALLVFILLIIFIGHMLKTTTTGSSNPKTTANTGGIGDASIVLTGYGATMAQWNANHSEDPAYAGGTSYDPTGGLGNGYADKYSAVLWINNRALGYQIGFPDNTTIATAKSIALQEFPGDATILWQKQNNSDPVNICYQMEVHSTTLAKALGSSGNAFVEFQTIATSDTSNSVGYYSSNVNSATLRDTNDRTAQAADGC